MGRNRDDRIASENEPRLAAHPRTLQDGQKRLVGVIDGFATYYDARRHRIDVRLERFDGTHYVTGYYQLQDTESVAEYVRRAKEHGADCGPLSRWVERRLQPDSSFAVDRLQRVRDRIERVVRTIR